MDSNANYVGMGSGVQPGTTAINVPDIDPNLSQEEKDLRLALALQQQENAAAYDSSQKAREAAVAARKNRTTRSNVGTGLAQVRKSQKAHGEVESSGNYYAPGDDSSDAKLAAELQKVEQTTAVTATLMEKTVQEGSDEKKASNVRSGRSHFHM